MKTPVILLITLLVASNSFAFTKAPREDQAGASKQAALPFELIKDSQKSCVYAPKARTGAEKTDVLRAAASEFRAKNPGSETKELCLALLRPNGSALINSYQAGKAVETIEPGHVSWASDPVKVEIAHGYEREDAIDYVTALAKTMSGRACVPVKKKRTADTACSPNYKTALEDVHKELGVSEHPLDWLLAP